MALPRPVLRFLRDSRPYRSPLLTAARVSLTRTLRRRGPPVNCDAPLSFSGTGRCRGRRHEPKRQVLLSTKAGLHVGEVDAWPTAGAEGAAPAAPDVAALPLRGEAVG